jgi:hypothetical protein
MPNRRIISVLTAAVAACAFLTAATSSTAAPAATAAPVALTGNIAGNPTSIEAGLPATFVITETNTASVGVGWFIQPFALTGVTIQSGLCVFGHIGFTGDGWTCEPFLRPGQMTTLVLTTKVTGAVGTVAKVKFCAYNGGGPGGNSQPCKTLSFKITA